MLIQLKSWKSWLAALYALPAIYAQSDDYFSPNSTGVKFQNGFERVYIQPFGNHGFRIRASILRDPTGREISALLDPPLEGPEGGKSAGLAHDQTVRYGDASVPIRNGDMVVEISDTGVLLFFRVESNGTRSLVTSEYQDTKALASRYYVQDFRSPSFAATFSFASTPDEQFYGAGQQACCNDHTVNKKGTQVPGFPATGMMAYVRGKGEAIDLINFNSNVPIPVYMSNKGYLQFFNVPSQGRLEFSNYRTRFISSEATVIDYYITTAEPGDFDSLQKQYTAATGRQPTPPDFILGYQQSKLRYWNQSQIITLAERFVEENVPVSLIVVDFFAWKFQGDWSFDPEFFPDPAAMAATVKNLTGAEMMVSLWPSVEDNSVNYLTLQENGWLETTRDGPGVSDSFNGVYTRNVDSTNPGAREFLWQRLNESYYSNGLRNFWIDQADGGTLGEPFVNNGQTINRIPYARTFAQYFIGTQEATGKAYPWLHQQAIQEGFNNLTGSDSTSTSCEHMSLTRSTFAGGQRFCSYLWSGDTDSRFDVLAQQITAGVSMAASGISSWTLDIGGFSGLNVSTDAGRELFVRWFSFGVFLPYTRVHGDRSCNLTSPSFPPFANDCPNEIWEYGDANFVILKQYVKLRYQLVPYVKRLFQKLQATGTPILRPLYHDFSLSDPFVVNATAVNNPLVTEEYLFGPRLLVAPVTEANATSKEVYLPQLTAPLLAQGFVWTHWWSNHTFGTGNRTVNISAPLDQIPVFYLGSVADILTGNV